MPGLDPGNHCRHRPSPRGVVPVAPVGARIKSGHDGGVEQRGEGPGPGIAFAAARPEGPTAPTPHASPPHHSPPSSCPDLIRATTAAAAHGERAGEAVVPVRAPRPPAPGPPSCADLIRAPMPGLDPGNHCRHRPSPQGVVPAAPVGARIKSAHDGGEWRADRARLSLLLHRHHAVMAGPGSSPRMTRAERGGGAGRFLRYGARRAAPVETTKGLAGRCPWVYR